jgi:hypothetical protein
MQTDTWLTQPSHPVKCPLCSKRLRDGSLICFSCGFQVGQIPARGIAASSRRSLEQVPPGGTSSVWIDPAASALQMSPSAERGPTKGILPAHPNPITPHPLSNPQAGEAAQRASSRRRNPLTPIPLRASAQNEASPHRGTGYPKQSASVSSGTDVTRLPTQPDIGPQMWQYESESYEVGSSVQSLSLLISEAPTQPGAPISSRSPNTPIEGSNLVTIDEIDTLPFRANSALLPAPVPIVSPVANLPQGIVGEVSLQPTSSDLPSWTAGEAARSPYAQRIADRRKNVGTALVVAQMKSRRNFTLNPLDNLRWWLLRPGRMEFLLWLCGTLLLIGVTCVLLLTAAFSFEWITPGFHSGTTYTSAPNNNPRGSPTGASGSSSRSVVPSLTLMDKGPLLPGHFIHLRGQGFSRHGQVTFTYDNDQPLLDQSGQPNMVRVDSQGKFTATILLGNWGAGKHRIVAHDGATNRSIEWSFVLAPGSSATGPTATATPPRVPATPTVVSGGRPTPVPTAVGATPVPPTSTPVTPTPTPATSPTVTPGTTPTASVTPGSTTTPGPGSNTPVASPTSASAYSSTSSSLSNALNGASDADVTARLADALANLGPWAWLVIPGYGVAMILLGVAGMLHRHRKV